MHSLSPMVHPITIGDHHWRQWRSPFVTIVAISMATMVKMNRGDALFKVANRKWWHQWCQWREWCQVWQWHWHQWSPNPMAPINRQWWQWGLSIVNKDKVLPLIIHCRHWRFIGAIFARSIYYPFTIVTIVAIDIIGSTTFCWRSWIMHRHSFSPLSPLKWRQLQMVIAIVANGDHQWRQWW